jgi:hypothetical protein
LDRTNFPWEEIAVNLAVEKSAIPRLLLAGVLAASGVACSPEGTGSIKIENPEAVRAKVSGPGATSGTESPKQAKAKALDEEAAKKHPKLN